MAETMTNQEILEQISNLSDVEAANLGVSPALQTVAGAIADGDRSALSSLLSTYSPLYNGFCGFVARLAFTVLSSAKYTDVYGRHHGNMQDGRPALGFVKPASAGTGNTLDQFAASPALKTITTEITATEPETITLYTIDTHKFVARVPISYESVKTAFANDATGLSDLINEVRKAAEDKVVEDRNNSFDDKLEDIADSGLIAAGTGSESSSNAEKATKVTIEIDADEYNAFAAAGYEPSALSDTTLQRVYTAVKSVYYGVTGRPSEKYNALGVKNNVRPENAVAYIDSDVVAEMETRIGSSTYNLDQLTTAGLDLKRLKAPYLLKAEDYGTTIACVGSADFIRDWPTADFSKEVETDIGVISNRFVNTVLAVAGYEPFCFIVLAPASGAGIATLTFGDNVHTAQYQQVSGTDFTINASSGKDIGGSAVINIDLDDFDSSTDTVAVTRTTGSPENVVVVKPDGAVETLGYTVGVDIAGIIDIPGVYTVSTPI